MSRDRVSVDITSSTIFRIILIGLGFWFVYIIADVLLMLFAAVIIGSALEPIANYLHRYRIPRTFSVAVIYILLLLILGGTGSLFIQPLTEQITQLAQTVPQVVHAVSDILVIVPNINREAVIASLQEGLMRVGENLANVSLNVVKQTQTFFSGLFTLLFVFVLAFYLVVEKDALKKFARLITPRHHLPYIEKSIDRAQRSIGRWVLAQLTLAVIVGTITGVGLSLLGIKYGLILGVLAGIMEIIPVIGPIIAAIPGVLVGVSQSWIFGLVTLVFYIVLQQVENHVLVPNIMRKAIGLNPLVTIIAILLGARLYGVVGVILSVPLATIVSIFLSDLFSGTATDELPG